MCVIIWHIEEELNNLYTLSCHIQLLKWYISVRKELKNVLCIDCSSVLCVMLKEGVNYRSLTSCLTPTLHLETSVSFTLYSVDFVTWSAVIVRMQVHIIPSLLTECWNTVKRNTCSLGRGGMFWLFDSLSGQH